MGEMLVMEVEIGEIKATHTETTVQYASKLPLKHKQKHINKNPFFLSHVTKNMNRLFTAYKK